MREHYITKRVQCNESEWQQSKYMICWDNSHRRKDLWREQHSAVENHFILEGRNGLEEPCTTACCYQREELGEYFRGTERYAKQRLSEKGIGRTVIRSVETVRQQQERLRKNEEIHWKYMSRKRTRVGNNLVISKEGI